MARPADRVQFDWALLLIPPLALVAVWPFLTQSLPSTDDGALHLFRLVQVDRCLRHGMFCLRWAPDFAHGYGYPGFNYYMNLPTLLAEGYHLAGLSFPGAIAAAIVSAFLCSGWGAYLLGRDIGGSMAGLVAATAYMYAPYQFFDSAYRGNLPEMWALALVPWVLWTGRRAAMRGRWRDILPFAVVYGALIWTHNIYTLLTSPVLGLYLLLLWWRRGHAWRDAWRLCAMVCLGLALGAFFWLPAFFERGWTRYSPALFDYEAAFLPFRELVSWPPQWDLSLLNPYPPRSLSWGMLILVALGIVIALSRAWGRRRRARPDASFHMGSLPGVEWSFWGCTFLVTSLMPLPVSSVLWRVVTPLQLVQMPWRVLGIASLAGSVCAGWAISLIADAADLRGLGCRPRRSALGVTCAGIVLVIATAVPWTYAAPFPQPEDPGVDAIMQWEYTTGLIGGTSSNEFLPRWVSRMPEEPADTALLAEHDPIIARLDETSLPEGAAVVSADYGLMHADLAIATPRAFRAIYKQFAFPGWRVEVDGEPRPLIATAPYGLLGIDVPAGEHRVSVRPTTTPFRAVGIAITGLAALAGVGAAVLDRAPRAPVTRPPQARMEKKSDFSEEIGFLLVAVLALSLLGFKEGLIDRTENIFRARRFDGLHVPDAQTGARIVFGNKIALLGYDLPTRPVPAGEPLRVDLYLSALRAPEGDYMAYARLVDDDGRLWSLRDNGRPEGFRPPPSTEIWPTDAYAHWAYLAYSLPGTPPGVYWIEVALFERDTWRGLNVLDAEGGIAGLTTRIGPVEIARPRTPPDVAALGIEQASGVQITPALAYLGSTQGSRAAQAGDALEITLYWEALQASTGDDTLSMALVSPDSAYPLAEDLPLGRREHPTTQWEAGERVRSPHRVRIPATVAAGQYAIQGTVAERGLPVAPPIRLGAIRIEPTARLFTIPAGIQHRVEANLGNRVTLLGYDLPQAQVEPGGTLPVTLYWQAAGEMQASYKVSVQLLAAEGVLAQVDAIPLGWKRPTTGWVPGEVLVDPYEIVVPGNAAPGTYRLIVSLYEEHSLDRLSVLDASGIVTGDHVVLDEAIVR